MKALKVVFVVNIYVVSEDGQSFIKVAENIEVKEPVRYKDAVIKAEILRQHPELRKKLRDRGWEVEIVEWF